MLEVSGDCQTGNNQTLSLMGARTVFHGTGNVIIGGDICSHMWCCLMSHIALRPNLFLILEYPRLTSPGIYKCGVEVQVIMTGCEHAIKVIN